MTMLNDLKIQWKHGGMVLRLVLVNVAVFVALWLTFMVLRLSTGSKETAFTLLNDHILNNLSIPSDLTVLLRKPWTVVSSLFTQLDPGHLFWNMALFWVLGRMYGDLLGGKRLLGTYILGGLSGGLLFVLSHNLFRTEGPMPTAIGASGSVTAVVMMIAAYRPHMFVNVLLIGPVKLMYFAAVFLFLDFIGVGTGDGVAHEAHIGGALYGLIAALHLKRGRDFSMSLANGFQRIGDLFARNKGSKMYVEKMERRKVRVVEDAEFNAGKKLKEERVNAILDKISRSGYDSLSKEEKDFLFRASHEQ